MIARIAAYLVIIPSLIGLVYSGYKYGDSFTKPKPRGITIAHIDSSIAGSDITDILPLPKDESDAPNVGDDKKNWIQGSQLKASIAADLGSGFNKAQVEEFLDGQTKLYSAESRLAAYQNLLEIVNQIKEPERKAKAIESFFPLFDQSLTIANSGTPKEYEKYIYAFASAISLILISIFSIVLITLENRKMIKSILGK